MYRRRAAHRIGLLLAALLLTAAALGSMFYAAAPGAVPRAAAYLSSALCAPDAAVQAARRLLDEALADTAQSPAAALPSPEPAPETPRAASVPVPVPVSSAQSAPADSADEPAEPAPEGALPIAVAHYGQGSGPGYVQSGAATVRNCTRLPDSAVAAEMMQPLPFAVQVGSAEPQVLIMHTHATESYELREKSWCDPAYSARSTDDSLNMVAVGAEMARALNAAGITALQDATLHDYPSYNGSYALSNATVRRYLAQYPSIKVVLDVHRDAIQKDDGTRVAPVAEIGGAKAAQVMLICGADLDGNLPNFRQNLRFASRWQDKMESMFPGLTRPALFDYRYYNQDLTTGSLLIEVGGHANTLEQAKYAGRLAGEALAALLADG